MQIVLASGQCRSCCSFPWGIHTSLGVSTLNIYIWIILVADGQLQSFGKVRSALGSDASLSALLMYQGRCGLLAERPSCAIPPSQGVLLLLVSKRHDSRMRPLP